MKKIIILALIALMLTGCKTTVYKTNNKIYWDKFIVIEECHNIEYGRLKIIYDKDTKVMYYYIMEGSSRAISPIYNADGTVMVYEGGEYEGEMYDRHQTRAE